MKSAPILPNLSRPTPKLMAVLLLLIALLIGSAAPLAAAGAPPAQTFYIPMPEDQVLAALRGIYPGGGAAGTADDLIHAGAVLILDNGVQTATRQSVIDFDGGDKLAATKTIAMTRTAWGTGSSTLLAGAVEVYDTNSW